MARPLSERGVMAQTCMDIQIAALHGLYVVQGRGRKEEENCFLLLWYFGRQMAGRVEGLNPGRPKPSRDGNPMANIQRGPKPVKAVSHAH